MGLGDSLRRFWDLGTGPPRSKQRAAMDPALGLNQWLSYFSYGGLQYPFLPAQTLTGNREEITNSFAGYVQGAYRASGPIFACMLVRLLLFSEARFQWRRIVKGRPGELFGTDALGILEVPWPNGVTGDLLGRAITDADLGGNFYAFRQRDRLVRLRPDWVTIVLGSRRGAAFDEQVINGDLDAEVIGYLYTPGGESSGRDPVALGVDQVAHWAPIPDPIASYRGMSWLTPIIRETLADSAASTHKLKFFENAATPNTVVSLDPNISEQAFKHWIDIFTQQHEGVLNAYKTLYLGGGASVEVIGRDLHQMDFKNVQGAGETRIAAAAGVPPVIVGLSEGLQAATYSNYGQARRRFADGTLRPLWRNFAASMQAIVPAPPGAQLWYDDRDIAFLKEDQRDNAQIQHTNAQTIRTLVDGGFEPETAVQAVLSGDFSRLKHTGLYSVQLQPPMPGQQVDGLVLPNGAPANGKPKPASLPPPNGKPSPQQQAAALLAPYLTPEE